MSKEWYRNTAQPIFRLAHELLEGGGGGLVSLSEAQAGVFHA